MMGVLVEFANREDPYPIWFQLSQKTQDLEEEWLCVYLGTALAETLTPHPSWTQKKQRLLYLNGSCALGC